MNIAVTGGNGLLAGGFAGVVSADTNSLDIKLFLVVREAHFAPNPISDRIKVFKTGSLSSKHFVKFLRDQEIDLVIHTAALADVERCENDVASGYAS